jgi:hypothetical protein
MRHRVERAFLQRGKNDGKLVPVRHGFGRTRDLGHRRQHRGATRVHRVEQRHDRDIDGDRAVVMNVTAVWLLVD